MAKRVRSFYVVWAVLVLATLAFAITVWVTMGWPTGAYASAPVAVAFLLGLPGAINNLRQLLNTQKRPPAGGGTSGMDEKKPFEWTASARTLLRVLASELPSHDDLLSCARESGTNPARARLSGTADNAWQSLIQIAHEAPQPNTLQDLLNAAAARSDVVAAAVKQYEGAS